MKFTIVNGNIIEQDVEVIVNPWNQNFIPWWLLILQGVSKEIKRMAGSSPFKEVRSKGFMRLGEACLTQAGELPFKGIIHVAGINVFWFSTEYSIKYSVINTMKIVNEKKINSLAIPLIGGGSGDRSKRFSKKIITNTLESINSEASVVIVEYSNRKHNNDKKDCT